MFTKFFFPSKLKEVQTAAYNLSESDSENDRAISPGPNQKQNNGLDTNFTVLESASMMSASKNRDLTLKLK